MKNNNSAHCLFCRRYYTAEGKCKGITEDVACGAYLDVDEKAPWLYKLVLIFREVFFK